MAPPLCVHVQQWERECAAASRGSVRCEGCCVISAAEQTQPTESEEALAQVTAVLEMSRLLPWKKNKTKTCHCILSILYVFLYMYTVSEVHFQIFIEELLQ